LVTDSISKEDVVKGHDYTPVVAILAAYTPLVVGARALELGGLDGTSCKSAKSIIIAENLVTLTSRNVIKNETTVATPLSNLTSKCRVSDFGSRVPRIYSKSSSGDHALEAVATPSKAPAPAIAISTAVEHGGLPVMEQIATTSGRPQGSGDPKAAAASARAAVDVLVRHRVDPCMTEHAPVAAAILAAVKDPPSTVEARGPDPNRAQSPARRPATRPISKEETATAPPHAPMVAMPAAVKYPTGIIEAGGQICKSGASAKCSLTRNGESLTARILVVSASETAVKYAPAVVRASLLLSGQTAALVPVPPSRKSPAPALAIVRAVELGGLQEEVQEPRARAIEIVPRAFKFGELGSQKRNDFLKEIRTSRNASRVSSAYSPAPAHASRITIEVPSPPTTLTVIYAKTFALVSAIARAESATYLAYVRRGELAPCLAWAREGIGTLSRTC
jgi:hypothetical protein